MSKLFNPGKGARRAAAAQRAEIEKAQGEQQKLIDKEKANVKAVERGQRKARTGNRGLLAYVDSELTSNLGA